MSGVLNKILTHKIAGNTFALFLLQFVNIIAPLLVLPYLSRVLGIEGFGVLMFALSLTALGVILTDYGFNLSATYTTAKRRGNTFFLSNLIGAVLIIKLILSLILIVGVCFYEYFIGFSLNNIFLPLLVCFNIIFQTVIPTWFFQGIEKMKNVTIFMVAAKLSYILLIFLFINENSPIELVIFFLALSNLLAFVISISFVYINGYFITMPSIHLIKEVFKDSTPFFFSRAAISIYSTSSTFLVGTFSGFQQAAFYGSCEKVYQASQSVTSPLAQALFPYMANNKDEKILLKIIIFVGLFLLLGCGLVAIWANELMSFVFGDEFYRSGNILQLFLVTTIINFVSVIFGYPAFASIDKIKIANYTVMFGAVVQMLCLITLYITDMFSALFVVCSVLLSEFLVMLLRISLYKFYKSKVS